MANRNVDKGREAENAVAKVLQDHGMTHAERRAKRGGTVLLDCAECQGTGHDYVRNVNGGHAPCDGRGYVRVPADAGDLTGVPGVVVQVKWSGYKSLAADMLRTEQQRRVAGADVGLLVRKRQGVGCGRAGEWDAYLPQRAVAWLMHAAEPVNGGPLRHEAVWHTDLDTAAALLATAGYGGPGS